MKYHARLGLAWPAALENTMADPKDPTMERLLADAGIAGGMRVLDVGCGRGEVSLMIARLVGRRVLMYLPDSADALADRLTHR